MASAGAGTRSTQAAVSAIGGTVRNDRGDCSGYAPGILCVPFRGASRRRENDAAARGLCPRREKACLFALHSGARTLACVATVLLVRPGGCLDCLCRAPPHVPLRK